MVKRIIRCNHCGEKYIYQASGEGCGNPLNNSHHCPACMETIRTSLTKVPVRFQARYQNIHEIPRYKGITLEMVLKWEKTSGRGWMQIFPGRVSQDGVFENIRMVRGGGCEVGDFRHTSFRVSTWAVEPSTSSIEHLQEFDAVEGRFTGEEW